jgi:hypothetical protein
VGELAARDTRIRQVHFKKRIHEFALPDVGQGSAEKFAL